MTCYAISTTFEIQLTETTQGIDSLYFVPWVFEWPSPTREPRGGGKNTADFLVAISHNKQFPEILLVAVSHNKQVPEMLLSFSSNGCQILLKLTKIFPPFSYKRPIPHERQTGFHSSDSRHAEYFISITFLEQLVSMMLEATMVARCFCIIRVFGDH